MQIMSTTMGQVTSADLQRVGMSIDQYTSLSQTMGQAIDSLTTADLQRFGMEQTAYMGERELALMQTQFHINSQMDRLRLEQERVLNEMQMGQTNVTSLMNLRQTSLVAAMEGYMGEIQLQLDQYRADTEGILAQADIIYKGAMTQLGIDQGMMDLMESEYNMRMKPIIDALSIELQQLGAEQAGWQILVDGLSAIGEIIPDSFSIFGGGD